MISAATDADLDEFCGLIGYQRTPSLRGIKFVENDVVQACTGFDYWTPNAAQMHIWVGGRLTRQYIREVCRYLFIECKKGLAIGVTPGDNKAALDFNRRIGFRVVCEIPNAWSLGTSMVIQELRAHECIWIGGSRESSNERCPPISRRNAPRNGDSLRA